MVYAGPRKGCESCKKRKIKCDGGTPVCENCLRRSLVCIQPQNPLDAILRDETAKVSGRAQRKAALPLARRNTSPNSLAATTQMRELEAFYFFMNTHVDVQRDPLSSHNFLELLPLALEHARPDSPLQHAINACAVFMQEAWSALMPETQRTRLYLGKALKSLNEAIRSPEHRLEDGTLLAVMLLELYDSMASGLQSQPGPRNHHKGALALVQQRGPLNYRTELAKRLLVAHHHHLIEKADDIDLGLEMDSLGLPDQSSSSIMPTNPAIELDYLHFDFVKLKPVVKNVTAHTQSAKSDSDLRDSLQAALHDVNSLNERFAQWYTTIPSSWYPTTISSLEYLPILVKKAGLYGDSCDLYPDLFVSSLMNRYRYLHATSLKWSIQLSHGLLMLPLSPDQQQTLLTEEIDSRAAIQALIDDFCASVPFHLGSKIKPTFFDFQHEWPKFPGDPVRNRANATAATAFGGWFLVLPLRAILMAFKPDPTISPPLLRNGQWIWLIRQLHRIATIYHVRANIDKAPGVPSPLFEVVDHSKQEAEFQLTKFGEGWRAV